MISSEQKTREMLGEMLIRRSIDATRRLKLNKVLNIDRHEHVLPSHRAHADYSKIVFQYHQFNNCPLLVLSQNSTYSTQLSICSDETNGGEIKQERLIRLKFYWQSRL